MNWNIHAKVDLRRGNRPIRYEQNLLMEVGDTLAHCWTVEVYDNGSPVDLAGATVCGYFTRADKYTVPVPGSVDGNVATVITLGSCTAIQGDLAATMKITLNGVTITIDAFSATVRNDNNENYLDPGSVVSNLQELLAMIDQCEAATEAAEAAAAAIELDETLTVHGHAADAKAVGDAIEAATAKVLTMGNSVQLMGAGDPRLTQLANGYIRNPTVSTSIGYISSSTSYGDVYYLRAAAACTVWLDLTNANKLTCLRVSNEQPAKGTGTAQAWTGNLYSNKQPSGTESNLPLSLAAAVSVSAGQYIAIWNDNDSWTLHINETAIPVLKPALGLTAQMREEVKAMLAELQALVLENN